MNNSSPTSERNPKTKYIRTFGLAFLLFFLTSCIGKMNEESDLNSSHFPTKSFFDSSFFYQVDIQRGHNIEWDYNYEFVIRMSLLDNFRSWQERASMGDAILPWTMYCNKEGTEDDSIIDSGNLHFVENNSEMDFEFERVLSIDSSKFDKLCGWRSFYITIPTQENLFPIYYTKITTELVKKEINPTGVINRITREMPEKFKSLIQSHSSVIKVSKSREALFCAIASYKDDVLLDGIRQDLTSIFESQNGPLDKIAIDCTGSNDLQPRIDSCRKGNSDDEVFCIIYKNYQEVMNWFSNSKNLINEIGRSNILTQELEEKRQTLYRDLDSKTFKAN